MSTPEIRFLLPLLDDEDEEVYGLVKEKIIESGPLSIPVLENALDSANSLLQHERLESLLFQLRMLKMKDKLVEWIHSDTKSLKEGWILISSLQGNDISPASIDKLLQRITRKIWLEMNRNQTSFEKISNFNRIFFEQYDFKVNYQEIPEIGDYYFDKVLILQHGNLHSLNILYTIIARKLDLPLIPVTINHKILLAYYDPVLSREAFIDIVHPFLFFIDLEHKGKIIGAKEFEYLLKENQMSWNPDLTISNAELLKRLLLRIKAVYHLLKDRDRLFLAEDLLKYFDIR